MTTLGMFDGPEGATPLESDDVAGLIPTWAATREDLNAAEQANVLKAVQWASSRRGPHSLDKILTEKIVKDLHRRMFGDVWKWAGEFRRHATNIGTDWPHIPMQLHDLLADVIIQTADLKKLPWPSDELAARFHHRLVLIHPFPNGNGRHARLAADLLIAALGEPYFTWGTEDLGASGGARRAYLDALRHADRTQDFAPLVAFARS